jgi:putative transcriptional regulator
MAQEKAFAGQLLVASPKLVDPNFRRTVVLVLQHDDDGAFGVVLNRPSPVAVAQVLPAWHPVVSQPQTLFQGGPVGLDGALGVATMLPRADGRGVVNRVVGPFGLVDLDADPADDGVRGITGLRVFAGHSGWGAGQLEAEVAHGDWYVLAADQGDVLAPEPATLWSRVLRRQGGTLAIVSTFPEDASLN